MNENTKRSPILRSGTISKRKVDTIIHQLKNIPSFWKKKFIQDEWQIVLTDKMPQEYGGMLGKFYADSREKQIWINVGGFDIRFNIIYMAFASYVNMAYAQIKELTSFNELIKLNALELTLFLRFRGNLYSNKNLIFSELFSFVIETDGKNTISKIDEPYQYVKKWVYGQIFVRNISNIPNYIEIGVDIIDEQIKMTDDAFKALPQKLQQQFLRDKWKIRLSNEKIINDSTAGLCSSFDRRIYIRGSSSGLSKIIWHEFGHFLDFKEIFTSHKFSFKNVYNKEKMFIKALYDNNEEFEYGISSSKEYFAEIFAFYMQNSQVLQKCAPESYNVIKNMVTR